jgi:hypothetical protein
MLFETSFEKSVLYPEFHRKNRLLSMLRIFFEILKKFNIDKRLINYQKIIRYAKDKKIQLHNPINDYMHSLLYFNPKIPFYLNNMPYYFIFTNNSKAWLEFSYKKLKMDKEIHFLKMKIDKFKIWKGNFDNLKLIDDLLNSHDIKYAIDLRKKFGFW